MRMVTATAVALALVGPAAPAATAHQPATDGIWRTDGYGTVLSIRNGTFQEYQTTAVSCLKGDSAQRTGPGTYTTPDGTVLTVRTRGSRDRASLRVDGSVGDRGLRRIPELPDACTRPAPEDPLAAFDVFWQSFEENYPFFSAKGIDWHALRDQYRPRAQAPQRHGGLAAERGVPDPLGQDLRRHGHSAAPHRAGLHRTGTSRQLNTRAHQYRGRITPRSSAPVRRAPARPRWRAGSPRRCGAGRPWRGRW
ncbi:hypothetical protein CCOS2040_17005 [Streptomyces albidoflavus]|nr:hypothetical protein CCOS2040_17005 [Streptomyces albidoflavus]SCD49534.1 hypothetical protein GA0115236_10876 [Streptomyces sp. IgraMP-1]